MAGSDFVNHISAVGDPAYRAQGHNPKCVRAGVKPDHHRLSGVRALGQSSRASGSPRGTRKRAAKNRGSGKNAMNLPTGVSVAAGILIAAKWLAQLWLDRLNEKSVRDHAAAVPEAFKESVDAATYGKSVE